MNRTITIADLFCGAGGTSTGAIEAAAELGHEVELTAVDHWTVAIDTHKANHPGARHVCTGIDDVNPRDLFSPGALTMLWASPECTHHSVARGGKPINEQSRATAWCVVRWADALQPPIILVENVPEFVTWGGLCVDGRPLAAQKGKTFAAWVAALRSLGYRVDWRVLCAADYGDPTTRRRLFVQAVGGGRKIVWPEPSHAPAADGDLFGSRKRWVAAREIIDWSIPGESIYTRKRPLSDKTMRRIMEGLRKFGLKPFLTPGMGERDGQVPRTHSVDEPAPTVAATGHTHLVEPFIVPQHSTNGARSVESPAPSVTTTSRGIGLAQPFLVRTAHGNDDATSDARRARDLDKPLDAVPCSNDVALIEPFIMSAGGPECGAIGLVEPFLVEYYGSGGSESVDDPLNTVTSKHRHALVRPTLVAKDGTRYLLDIRFRMLQPHELAAAQGFPRSYKFAGNKTQIVKQVGNAVPCNLAKALVKAVLSQRSDA